jgi:ATP-dependent helicase/nuclease subunit A
VGEARLNGIIDRLVIRPDHVIAVDFKTNATVPATPETCPSGILRQMGAYLVALQQVYPGRRIEIAVLWTKTGDLMPLSHDIVMRALNETRYLDDSDAAT